MDIPLKCKCGSLRGVATGIPKGIGKRVVCMCGDCQAFTHFLGCSQAVLDPNGGTDVTPMRPSQLKFTQGVEQLRCVRLSDDGMMRWYAGCCKWPIANTMASSNIPLAMVIGAALDFSAVTGGRDEVLGPVSARVQGKYGIGTLPPGAVQGGSFRVTLDAVRFLVSGLIRRAQKPSPFFDAETGEPVVEPLVLSDEEYYKLRAMGGPRP